MTGEQVALQFLLTDGFDALREAVLQSKVMAVLNHRDSPCRVWRNNVGMLKDARGIPIRYGLAPGSADLVGLVTSTGQFLAVEIKTEIGRLSPEQKAWLGTVRQLGGQAVVLRSSEEAERFVETLRNLRPMCCSHKDCLDHPDLGEACAVARRKKGLS